MFMNIKATKTHTTTNIGINELEVLNKLAATYKMKNIQFVNAAVLYLKKTGINPNEPELSPKDEIAKLEKRVNEVIKYFRVFEQDKLMPILERLIILEKKIEASLGDLPMQSEIHAEFAQFQVLLKKNAEDAFKVRQVGIQSIEKTTQLQVELEKINKMLISFFEAFKNRGVMGKLSDEDINSTFRL